MLQPLWRTVWKFLKKTRIELPYDPAIPLLSIHPEKRKTHWKRYMHPSVYSSTIYNIQDRALLVKNPPAMQETWVRSLGWEDPLEKGKATHSSILAWRIPMDRGTWQAAVHRVAKSLT